MEYIIAIIILLLAIPLGYLLKYYTKDEMKQGKKYFKILGILSLVLGIIMISISFPDPNLNKTAVFSLFFIAIVSFISWRK